MITVSKLKIKYLYPCSQKTVYDALHIRCQCRVYWRLYGNPRHLGRQTWYTYSWSQPLELLSVAFLMLCFWPLQQWKITTHLLIDIITLRMYKYDHLCIRLEYGRWLVQSPVQELFVCLFVWWCLKPLSKIFQLFHGDQFYRWKKPRTRRKPPICRKSLTNFNT